MEKAGVPIIPGMKSAAAGDEECAAQARKLGFPVMVKASAGGGGKGMRVVCSEDELRPALEAGRREAKSAFGDDSVYLEKFIEDPRHVEFQVLADDFGSAVHLFERECSIQRRHQKIIEESPSPALDPDLRARMGETARRVMAAARYNNAGTVEFLLDKERNFYFLEVNARLQVEHPVTEMVTGTDLVHQQLFIAAGRRLELRQEDLRQRGHAIECRIYAEDPTNRFLPSPGRILYLKEPTGPGVRNDGGIYGGWDVPIHYDPILAKLIVWAGDRESARRRMLAALDDYVLLGISTPIPFLKDVLRHPVFRDGRATTGFIKEHMEGWSESAKDDEKRRLALAAAAWLALDGKPAHRPAAAGAREAYSPWRSLGRWRLGE
jgi:acetyl-CoA carboxylase biotin carboxylase subunit